jgi:hypothetical protein
MNINTLVRALALSLIFISSIYSQNTTHKLRVGVMEFTEKNDIGTNKAGFVVAMLLNTHLKNLDLWELDDRITLNEVFNEQSLQQVALNHDSEAVKLGKISGIEAMITGSVLRIGKNRIVSARLIDVTTSQIKQSASVRFNAPEDLETAVQKLAYLLSGYTSREYYTLTTRKALSLNRLGASMGSGWGQTRIEHRYLKLDEFGDKITQYTNQTKTDLQGVALDFNFQSLYFDAEIGGIIPNHVGMLRTQAALYPWTHVGFAGQLVNQSHTVVQNGTEYGSMNWNSLLFGLSFRASPHFRFGLYKGKSMTGTLRYHDALFESYKVPISDDFDFLKGPTLAQADFLWGERYSIRALYFHDQETTNIFEVPDPATQIPLAHVVSGYVRLFSLQFGVNFAL